MNKKILFFGANGYLGHGMAENLLKQNTVYVYVNKRRENIDLLVSNGAKEIKNFNEIQNIELDCLMLCVTNTPIAIQIANRVAPLLKNSSLVIDWLNLLLSTARAPPAGTEC